MFKFIFEETEDRVEERPVIIVPPISGFDGDMLVHWKPDCSIVNAANVSGWSTVTVSWDKNPENYSMNSLILHLENSIEDYGLTQSPIVGLCQGGLLAAILAARNPGWFSSLTVAGSPIDLTIPSHDLAWTANVPMYLLETIVMMAGGVMPGWLLLQAWRAGEPKLWIYDLPRLDHKTSIENWYDHPVDISGRFYLDTISKIFKQNQLAKGELVIGGLKTKLEDISCKVHIVTASQDTVVSPSQTKALDRFVERKNVEYHEVSLKHVALYTNKLAIEEVWKPLFLSGSLFNRL